MPHHLRDDTLRIDADNAGDLTANVAIPAIPSIEPAAPAALLNRPNAAKAAPQDPTRLQAKCDAQLQLALGIEKALAEGTLLAALKPGDPNSLLNAVIDLFAPGEARAEGLGGGGEGKEPVPAAGPGEHGTPKEKSTAQNAIAGATGLLQTVTAMTPDIPPEPDPLNRFDPEKFPGAITFGESLEKGRPLKRTIGNAPDPLRVDPQAKQIDLLMLENAVKLKGAAAWNEPIDAKPEQMLVFNGKDLCLYENGKAVRSWPGVAGRKGSQTGEHQRIPDTGPLPEGVYVARTQRYQDMPPTEFVKGIASRGSWPGGPVSWGSKRVWLEPSANTNTFERTGFTIHGGWFSGSNGCIDLTSHMEDFADWYKHNGKDVIIVVNYPTSFYSMHK